MAKPSPSRRSPDADPPDADAEGAAEAFVGFCWPGPSLYPDFCDPQAREAWAELFDFQAGDQGLGGAFFFFLFSDPPQKEKQQRMVSCWLLFKPTNRGGPSKEDAAI